MTKYYLLFYFVLNISALALLKTQDSNLLVFDSKSKQEISSYLIKNSSEPLELVCKLKNYTHDQVSLSWMVTLSDQNGTIETDDDESLNETSISTTHDDVAVNGSIKLYISSLKILHSGSYVCVSSSNFTGASFHEVKLFVRPKKVVCGKKFECGDNQCISIIYKCDGVADCKSKSDEDPEICGINPCLDRLRCNNGRCIPNEWCKVCDHTKTNCTNRHRHDCCPSLDTFPKGPLLDGDDSYSHRFKAFPDSPSLQHEYDINLIQTTIYTVIGCALVFMVIVTIFVIAICRVHLKRSQPHHLPNNRQVFATTAYHRAFTQEICPGLLVTYNINNGVQIVGSPVDPPPYSEVASLPPQEGPPPPYTLSQPYDGENLRNVRSVQCETSPKSGDFRRGLSSLARVSSEPSLANRNRL